MNSKLLRPARWLTFLLGIAFSLAAVYSYTYTAKMVFGDPALVLPDEELWTAGQLANVLAELNLPGNFYAVYTLGVTLLFGLSFLVCGWLILLRRSQDWFGMYLSLLLLSWTSGVGVFSSMPNSPLIEGSYVDWFMWPGLFLLLYFFPSGHIVPGWARWFVLGWILFSASVFVTDILGVLPENFLIFLPVLIAVLLVGGYAQIYRYRRAATLERQQIKLVVFSLVFFAAFFVFFALAVNVTGLVNPSERGLVSAFVYTIVLSTGAHLVFMGVPISITVAVLRYRLWDVDIIIRKTLLYSVMIGLLALVYIGGIILLQEVIAGFGVRQSPAAIVLSTLAIAILFNQVRRWLRPRVDRLFFRQKYDAEQALTAFATQTRDEVDIECLTAALVSALEETVHPVRVSLWLEASGVQVANSATPSSGEHPSASQARMMVMDIAPDDPLRSYLLKESEGIEIEALDLDSAALRHSKEAGMKLSVPFISQGELIGVLNLGPRRSEQGYSSDDRRLISNLAIRAAPALRVAQLVHQRLFEAGRRERIEQELRVARLVQETLLPKDVPSIPGWELAALWQPAREMSGDFYDFLPFPDGRLGLIIGDVAGKGMPAALVMGITQSILRATAERMAPPAEVLERANNLILPQIPANMFATCLYMILDPATGCLQFANAGHNLPILQTDRGVVEPRATGMPLGLLPGMTYDQNDVQLMPGNRMLMYTDGLVEAHNPQGEMFGTPYLHELIGQEIQVPPGSSSGAALIEHLLASLAGFTGSGWEQEDDVTMVTLDYLGPEWPVEEAQRETITKESPQTLVDFKLSGRSNSN